jgi:hypothetical protein
MARAVLPTDHLARRDIRPLAGLDAGHHVGLGLVDQLVGQPFQAVGQRPGLRQLQLAAFGRAAGPDQLHHA